MTTKVLFVDDEPNVLDGLRRLLRKDYDFETAIGGEAGLALMQDTSFAVVVSDMRMPGMSGQEFLAKAHIEQPDAVQMILSGQADLESTVSAVNEGSLFRFLIKPADRELLTKSLDLALRQYQLVVSERELLQETLQGAVASLTEVLALVSPVAAKRSGRVADLAGRLGPAAGLSDDWRLGVAAMLSTIGYAVIPPDIVMRADRGEALSATESQMLAGHAQFAARLLKPIPRMEDVALIISATHSRSQQAPGFERHVEVLKLADLIARDVLRGDSLDTVLDRLRAQGEHDDALLDALRANSTSRELVDGAVLISELLPGMILKQDVYSSSQILLAGSESEITENLLHRLKNFAETAGVREPINVQYERVVSP